MARYTFASNRPSRGLPATLAVLLVLSVALNVYLLFFQNREGRPARDRGSAEEPATAPADGAAEGADGVETAAGASPDDRAIGDFTALQGVDLEIRGSLSQAFDGAVEGRRSIWLTATCGRILVWWVDLSSDLRSGDRLRVLYEPSGDEEVRIAALVYRSLKQDREYRAYYHQREGDDWGSYWDAEGLEVPARLKAEPIQDYQQITALLGDGRDHRGIDFLAPVGTPVYAPVDATVTRTTWNFKYNGNSLELRFADGTMARYLHLEGIAEGVTAGAKIAAGQQVATCGNTGRTSAPHLHYELEQAGRIIDPLDYHGRVHRRIEGPELETYRALVERYDEALDRLGEAGEDERSGDPAEPASDEPGV